MRRAPVGRFLLPLVALLLTGCGAIGEKTASISVIYGVTALLSLLLLVVYCGAAKKRDIWYVLLFSSVFVVNIGYFALATSKTLEVALWANRLAYLGSVFLPFAMWMIILKTTHLHPGKWLSALLLAVAVAVFLIAASPGYLPIYYKEVSLQIINGVASLVKTYGPLHVIYLVYLLGYFATMVTTIVHATVKDKVDSVVHAAILAVAVFINIGVWLIEQLARIDFEILSVSYIISESFLLCLNLLIAEAEKKKETLLQPKEEPSAPEPDHAQFDREQQRIFMTGIQDLTPKERQLYECYIAGMATGQILEQLAIKENTLKFHSKNLYGKLGVSSRKQLLQLHKSCAVQQNEQ